MTKTLWNFLPEETDKKVFMTMRLDDYNKLFYGYKPEFHYVTDQGKKDNGRERIFVYVSEFTYNDDDMFHLAFNSTNATTNEAKKHELSFSYEALKEMNDNIDAENCIQFSSIQGKGSPYNLFEDATKIYNEFKK